jgi:hypothetical protein
MRLAWGVGLALLATFVLTGHGLQVFGAYALHTSVFHEVLGVAMASAPSARWRVACAPGSNVAAHELTAIAAILRVAFATRDLISAQLEWSTGSCAWTIDEIATALLITGQMVMWC